MNIYVIRWMSRIDNEEWCGTFEVCYSSEEEAKDALVQDFEDTKTQWASEMKDYDRLTEKMSNDFASIVMEDAYGKYDYHEWYIDKLELKTA